MPDRIHHVAIRNARLDPAEAEVWIDVELDQFTPTTEVRGRLMGPRCRYASTVEVAYAVTARPGAAAAGASLPLRVLIPEPCWWEPQSPFLYEGPLELRQDGQLVEQRRLKHGLRAIQWGPRGLRFNGRPLTLRGIEATGELPAPAEQLRQAGCNMLFAPSRDAPLWDSADAIGFLMIGRVATLDEIELALVLHDHPCSLGWLLAPELAARPADWRSLSAGGQLIGVELSGALSGPLPQGLAFVAGPAGLLPDVPLARMEMVEQWPADAAASARLLGWVQGATP